MSLIKSLTPILVLFIAFATVRAQAQQKLIVIGGGKRPPAALKLFGDWAGQEQGRILIVMWATQPRTRWRRR